jgi:hypothetical protein
LFSPFFIILFCFTSFSPGIFYISGNLSSSSFTNSTFTNITFLPSQNSWGSAMYIETSNYSSFTIDRCIFATCKANYGGALYLYQNTPYIYLSRTRFENNDADFGDDILVNTFPCFNLAKSGSLDSSVCSTTPLGNRVYCGGDIIDLSHLQNNCSEEAV